jgi:hypothetical protein
LFQDEKSYNKLWSVLKEQGAFQEAVSPKRFMTDFEQGLKQSAMKNLPWAKVHEYL